MSPLTLPKMLVSESEGWQELQRRHPSVSGLFWTLVVPLSLIPAAMFVYSALTSGATLFASASPPLSAREALSAAVLFYLAQLAMVPLMAVLIRQAGEGFAPRVEYEEAFTLAAVAPVPLWLAPLALFVPSAAFQFAVLALAWFGSGALIYHGVRPLLRVADQTRAHSLALLVLVMGVVAWIALMAVLVMLLGMLLGWR